MVDSIPNRPAYFYQKDIIGKEMEKTLRTGGAKVLSFRDGTQESSKKYEVWKEICFLGSNGISLDLLHWDLIGFNTM